MSKNNSKGKCERENSSLWESSLDDSILQLLDEPLDSNSILRNDEKYLGFDNNAGDSWIYPINYPIRDYQMNITKSALFRNTLVVLPTGLGKTFIAAVVMYNIYRWYPTGKVIFMAPTKPLVNQQIQACYNIMGIPKDDTAEITGVSSKKNRIDLWQNKRVFYATPQAVISDIFNPAQNFPFSQIKLIVFDEAHKAKGRYAYTEVAETVFAQNRYFRVLALTATPGRSVEDVAEVCKNLYISHLEVRSESSIDVNPFLHKRKMKTVVVPMGEQINVIRSELIAIIDPYMRKLIDFGVLPSDETNRNRLFYEHKKFRERCLVQSHPQQSEINSNFSMVSSLYYALELLERHGVRVFLNSFEENDEKIKFTVAKNWQLRNLIKKLRQDIGPNPFAISDETMTNGQINIPKDLDFGHPKFEKAREFLLEHFEKNADGRAIIFCEYRESVTLVHRLLLQHRPLLKPKCLVGQGGTTGYLRSITQKQQVEIMNDFRKGVCNILIATSIAEEGLDVGEVDLIVCFDISTTNPIRFVQRIGRTGRKKDGRVIMLVTEGKEEASLKQVLACKDKVNNKLIGSPIISKILYKNCPRLVPTEFNPKCLQANIQISDEPSSSKPKKKQQKNKNLPKKSTQDMRKYFQKVELDAEDREIFAEPTTTKTTSKGIETSLENAAISNEITENCENVELSDISDRRNSQPEFVASIDPKHIRKINKFLRSSPPPDNTPTDTIEILKSKRLSPMILRLYLDSNPDFVRDIFEKMNVIWAISEDDINMNDLTKNERDIRETYNIIEQSFGDKTSVLEFLERNPKENDEEKNFLMQMKEKYDKVFSGLREEGYCCNYFDNMEKELAEMSEEDESLPPSETLAKTAFESMVYDAMTENYINTDDIVESKYCSQWDDLSRENIPIKHQSTPKFKEKSSFIQKTKNNNSSRQELSESTIGKAFAKQADKMNTTEINNKSNHIPDTAAPKNGEIVLRDEKKSIIPEDFFNDDFDELLIANSEIIEKEANMDIPLINKTSIDEMKKHNFTDIKSIDSSLEEDILNEALQKIDISLLDEDSIQPSNVTLDIICSKEKEETPKTEANINNPELEDFDINDFLEIFPDTILDDNSDSHFSEDEDIVSKQREDGFRPSSSNKKKITLASKFAKLESPACSNELVQVDNSLSPTIRNKMAIQTESETSPSIFNRKKNSLRSIFSHSDVNKEDGSPLLRNRPKLAMKRKISASDSDNENHAAAEQDDSSSEDVFPNSQEITVSSSLKEIFKQRMKRRRRCEFIDEEAEVEKDSVAISEHESEDDSIIILDNDDIEENAPSVNMHAKYLQSTKSPVKRPGAFKIPEKRVFNDYSRVFSQTQLPQCSQYEIDSFCVEAVDERDTTICPLERAEKILKDRKREERKAKCIKDTFAGSSENKLRQKKRKRILQTSVSSDDDEA